MKAHSLSATVLKILCVEPQVHPSPWNQNHIYQISRWFSLKCEKHWINSFDSCQSPVSGIFDVIVLKRRKQRHSEGDIFVGAQLAKVKAKTWVQWDWHGACSLYQNTAFLFDSITNSRDIKSLSLDVKGTVTPLSRKIRWNQKISSERKSALAEKTQASEHDRSGFCHVLSSYSHLLCLQFPHLSS